MHLSFSENGPDFPIEVVDALLEGEVVFLCGAGISAQALPSFKRLVEKTFMRLNMTMNSAEKKAFKEGRYEEALGSVGRRLAEPEHLVDAVAELCKPAAGSDLTQHRTILRLSRDLENRPLIVTTNFDTMLEMAFHAEPRLPEEVQRYSLAGQALPAPGGSSFSGIIHIHGRVEDAGLRLDRTPFVVTSADYGDAYMRSGWASRFLFDLCRCKTVVLVGYRAGDAPVRYFLNVLAADRSRFPDLKDVYALDAVDPSGKADVGWNALGVIPITYEKEPGGSHSPLWRDLASLADIIEQPRKRLKALAEDLLSKKVQELTESELNKVRWLFKGRRDLFSVFIKCVTDKAWLDLFQDEQLWSEEDASWVVAGWIARDLQSPELFAIALQWVQKLQSPFVVSMSRHIQHARDLPPLWTRAWRLLELLEFEDSAHSAHIGYHLTPRLNGNEVLQGDVQRAVDCIAPRLTLGRAADFWADADAPAEPLSLYGLTKPRLTLKSVDEPRELINALLKLPDPCNVLMIANAKFQALIGLSQDAGAITPDYDNTNIDVPSVEPHSQNEFHDGLVQLVELLAALVPKAAATNRGATLNSVNSWAPLPGLLGPRLYLNAHRSQDLCDADEAISAVLSVTREVFWSTRRELALVLRERVGNASQATVAAVEERIISEASDFFRQYPIDEGEVDWRDHARDEAVWLRLKMLEMAGRLSVVGQTELDQIQDRREHLNRPVEEADYFGSYSTDVQYVRPDATPFLDAIDEDRIAVAHETRRSFDLEKREGWRAFCQADPEGAFRTLTSAPLEEANAVLWGTFISTIQQPSSEARSERRSSHTDFVAEVVTRLSEASDGFLSHIVRQMTDLYVQLPRASEKRTAGWWQRLFAIATGLDVDALAGSDGVHSRASYSAGGRLTLDLLQEIEARIKTGKGLTKDMRSRLHAAANGVGGHGVYARAVLLQFAGFVALRCGRDVTTCLKAALSGDSAEAKELRQVLLLDSPASSTSARVFGTHILKAITELTATGNRQSQAAAAKLLYPMLARYERRATKQDERGITAAAVTRSLRICNSHLRAGFVEMLVNAMPRLPKSSAEPWNEVAKPLLDAVWPPERALVERRSSRQFAALAIAAGPEFPAALKAVGPYLTNLGKQDSVSFLDKSQAPAAFPEETLTLLWKLYGRGNSDMVKVPELLDKLAIAKPALRVDRRWQWLDRKATRYD